MSEKSNEVFKSEWRENKQELQQQFKELLRFFRSTSVREIMELLRLNTTVQGKNLIEFLKVCGRYYCRHWPFLKTDLACIGRYLLSSPFVVSKRFLEEKGVEDVYAYGETPLTTMDLIACECGLNEGDVVYELGAGRGRVAFWLKHWIGCQVKGVEQVPDFVEYANSVKKWAGTEGIEFTVGDICEGDYSDATVIYLYGTCLDEQTINKLTKRFEELPSGTKIITVSYPLTDYTNKPLFEVMKRFSAPFTWGKGDVYLQCRR